MRIRSSSLKTGGALLLAACVLVMAGCQPGGFAPTVVPPTAVAPSATPWVVVVTATPTSVVPPTAGPSPTPAPTATSAPPPTLAPSPTLPPPEPYPPLVQILAPAEGTQYAQGQQVSVQFTASDQSGIDRVSLVVGGTSVAERSYQNRPTSIGQDTLAWTPGSTGQFRLSVVAYDPHGNDNAGTAPAVDIQVNPKTSTPTVVLNSPTGPVVWPAQQPLQFQTTIHDEVGVTLLELWQIKNGQPTRLEYDPNYHATQPWGYQWAVSHTWSDLGERSVFVKAQDQNGAWAQSAAVSVNVVSNNPPSVNTPSYDPNPVTQGQVFHVIVQATDGNGLKEFHLHVDDQVVTKSGVLDGSPQSHTWHGQWQVPANFAVGPHKVWVRVEDTVGQSTVTPEQDIVVQGGAPAPTQPPAAPDVKGTWRSSDGVFQIKVEDQHPSGRLIGKLHLLQDDKHGDMDAQQSNIVGHTVTIKATVDGHEYNFFLTVSDDGQQLSGNWSGGPDLGLLTPVTFVKS
ncbi:MAG: hypothetical protein KKA73_02950 [Chloroflexi bacterium]|nr:hypothetical protein [Chloroflexota bacterium]MBU1746622.1 hypothetical protein [Chloroflexota bacterium]